MPLYCAFQSTFYLKLIFMISLIMFEINTINFWVDVMTLTSHDAVRIASSYNMQFNLTILTFFSEFQDVN